MLWETSCYPHTKAARGKVKAEIRRQTVSNKCGRNVVRSRESAVIIDSMRKLKSPSHGTYKSTPPAILRGTTTHRVDLPRRVDWKRRQTAICREVFRPADI